MILLLSYELGDELVNEFDGMIAGEGEPVLLSLRIAAPHQSHRLLEHVRHSVSLPPVAAGRGVLVTVEWCNSWHESMPRGFLA